MKTEPSKLTTSNRCPGGCGADCQGSLWHDHGRTFEDMVCKACATSWGRVDGGQWHLLGSTDEHGLLISRRAREVKA